MGILTSLQWQNQLSETCHHLFKLGYVQNQPSNRSLRIRTWLLQFRKKRSPFFFKRYLKTIYNDLFIDHCKSFFHFFMVWKVKYHLCYFSLSWEHLIRNPVVSLALEHFHFQHRNQEIFPQVVHSNGQRSGPLTGWERSQSPRLVETLGIWKIQVLKFHYKIWKSRGPLWNGGGKTAKISTINAGKNKIHCFRIQRLVAKGFQ